MLSRPGLGLGLGLSGLDRPRDQDQVSRPTSLATTSVKVNLDVRYDVSKMRTHLTDCLVRHEVLSFPTVRPQRGGNKPARKVDCITI